MFSPHEEMPSCARRLTVASPACPLLLSDLASTVWVSREAFNWKPTRNEIGGGIEELPGTLGRLTALMAGIETPQIPSAP